VPRLEGVLNEALTDALAAQVREGLHPSGKGGKLGAKRIVCSASQDTCTATFDVQWQGGILGRDYVSALSWTLTEKDSSVTVDRETSLVSADAEHIGALNQAMAAAVHKEVKGGVPGAPGGAVAAPALGGKVEAAAHGPGPASRLAAYAPKARSSATFARLPLWAALPAGTTSCDGKTKLTEPRVDDGANESDVFKRHERQEAAKLERAAELAKRSEYRDSILGSLVYTEEGLDLSPSEFDPENLPVQSQGENAEHPFDVQIGEYDFGKEAYPILVRSMASSGWAIGAVKPVIRNETVAGSVPLRRRTGVVVGGREVTVRAREGFAYEIAQNHSKMALSLKLPPADAKVLAERCKRKGLFSGFKGCVGKLRVLQRVTSLDYHKVCNGDDPGDNFCGIGELFNAVTLGVEVEVDGEWLASTYDDAELGKL
jgi:hypothetical protein